MLEATAWARPADLSAPAPAKTARPRRWPWAVLTLLTLILVVALAAAAALWHAAEVLGEADGLRIVIDGHTLSLPELTGHHFLILTAALFVIGVALMVVVPLAVLLALLSALFGVALAIVVAVGAALLATSPLWLAVLLIWWLARRSARDSRV